MTTQIETIRTGFDPFLAMDKLDDEAILAELKGRILDKWVYHFPQDGKEVWGLSKVGVDQACAEMAKHGEVIRELSLTFQPDPTDSKFMLFVAVAARYAVSKDGKEVFLDQTVGTKRQGIKVGNSDRPNNFFFEQGAMKAFRNARSRLISEATRARIIGLAKEQGKVQEVKGAEIVDPGANEGDLGAKMGEPSGNKWSAPVTQPQLELIGRLMKSYAYPNRLIYGFLDHALKISMKAPTVQVESDEVKSFLVDLNKAQANELIGLIKEYKGGK